MCSQKLNEIEIVKSGGILRMKNAMKILGNVCVVKSEDDTARQRTLIR